MTFTKVAPAGIGTEPGSTIRLGDSLLHSTGLDVGTGTGVGVTIRQHGDATFSGIVTASAFFGDGSGLEGVSSSGIGTPLSDDDTSDLNKIYYANQELVIDSTVTVNHPDTGIAAYTHYQDLVVKDNADFIVADGDTFIPDVLGINTSSLPNPVSSATGGRIRAGTLTNAGANGAPNFPNGLTGTAGTFSGAISAASATISGAISAASATITGNLGVGGVLTYEDVTNIDSVGVITARDGLRVTGIATVTGGVNVTGVSTFTNDVRMRTSTSNTDVVIGNISQGNFNRGTLAVKASADANGTPLDANIYLEERDGAEGYTLSVDSDGDLNFHNSGSATPTLELKDDNNVAITNGNLVIGTSGKGIDFSATANSSGSVDGELLDDYEEGSFTPSYSVASGSITTFSQRGEYVKIGRVVHFMFSCSANGSSSPSGTVSITGLPFSAEIPSANGPRGGGGVVFAGYHAPPELSTCIANGTTIQLRLNNNTYLQANTSGTGFGYNAYQISGFGSYMTTA